MAQAPAQRSQARVERLHRGGQMDDFSLRSGRNGAVVGGVVGLVLGITVWQESWLILAIAVSFYGALVGAAGGVTVGALYRR